MRHLQTEEAHLHKELRAIESLYGKRRSVQDDRPLIDETTVPIPPLVLQTITFPPNLAKQLPPSMEDSITTTPSHALDIFDEMNNQT